ncbi:MAG: ATP-binding protein [Verrucomicrobiota bacterium]
MDIEKALRLSEERFSKAFRASPIPLAIQSLKSQIYVDANDGFQQITGFNREELIGRTPLEINLWEDGNEAGEILLNIHSKIPIRNRRAQLRTKRGEIRDTLLSIEIFELDNEPFVLTNVQDITEQIKLEYELRQSQKMEAIGQLAAGVAHDFNNVLTVVQGHACLLLGSKLPKSPDYRSLETISAAAERASKLVRQLLTFNRKQFLQIRTMDIRETLDSVSEMFPSVLGEHINVKVVTNKDLPFIDADAGMMEQILMNLAVNGRDAMPQGGTLTIQADTVVISPETAYGHPESRPGKFLRLMVTDTGCGISPEVLLRIFEPFFTTKPVGQGTGLGLATVYGVTKRHKGWVEVQSQPNQGTTFKVYIPASEKVLEKEDAKAIHDKRSSGDDGDETILVVEDEDALRELVVEVLKPHGYNVISACSGVVALEEWGRRKEKIHLLITDLVMPGGVMGRDLGEQMLAEEPDLQVIYTSGYSPGLVGKDMALLEGKNFPSKPYPPIRLLKAVRDCLDCA